MDFISALIIFSAIANLILGFLVLVKSNRKSNIFFIIFCFVSFLVGIIDFVFRLSPQLNVVVWSYAFGSLLSGLGLLWFYDLKKQRLPFYMKLLIMLPGIAFFFLSLKGLVVSDVYYLTMFGYKGSAGPLFKIYTIYTSAYTFFLLINFYLLRKKLVLYERLRIDYAITGLLLYGMVTGVVSLTLPAFLNIYDFTAFDAVSSLFFIAFTAYAITRYRLMNIRNLVRSSSIFALLVIIIGGLLAILSILIADFLGFWIANSYLVSSFIAAIIIAVLFIPLKNILERLTDRFLFSKSYKSSEVLFKINEIISSTIDLHKLLSLVSDNLKNIFHYSKIGYAFIDGMDKKAQLKIYYQDGFEEKTLEQFSQGKIKVLPWYFSESKEIRVIDELKAQYEAGEYQPKSVELLTGLYDLNVSLVIPLFAKEGLIGLIILGGKKSGDPYTGEDLKVLNIIAGQLGISIENARLYEQQKNFNLHLKDEVKKATAKLEAANTELQRLDDAKSEFLSIASHQLRTPLTITKGYVSMMNEGSFGKVPKIIKENLNKIYTANERLLNLVENLLDISRIEAGRLEFNLEAVDLVETSKALVADFQAKAKEKKLKLEFYPDPKMPKCLADAQKVKEVVSNLIDNSIKYTNKGEIVIGIHQESQSLVFSCQDTGMGIESEDLPRLFNKFVRGKGMMTVHTEGTGLGLYFARVVIENMGGRIWAESPGKNRGSKFSFSLPLADKKKAQKIKITEHVQKPA